MRLTILSVLFVILGSIYLVGCGGAGPKVTACVVDGKEKLFQCVNYKDERWSIPFAQGEDLECISPQELERGLKACKDHKAFETDLCSVKTDHDVFICTRPDGSGYSLDFKLADNFFCVSDQDRRRILERCNMK